MEIYNEQIRDLLRPGADHDEKHAIATAPVGGCPTVSGVERELVTSVDAAAGLVRRAALGSADELAPRDHHRRCLTLHARAALHALCAGQARDDLHGLAPRIGPIAARDAHRAWYQPRPHAAPRLLLLRRRIYGRS